VAFLTALALAAPLAARDFNGFYTPEFVKSLSPPYVPVSTTASFELEQRISGRVTFRELGSFRAEGAQSGSDVELALRDGDGALVGRARGTISGGRLELRLELLDRDGQVGSRGRLSLDTAAEWRASPVTKQKHLRDRAKRFWYAPDFNDSDWEEIELPDNNEFGEDVKRQRYYRSRFWLREPSEALSVVFSSDDGIWIYVNGHLLGHWGARENEAGCVNDPLERCGINGTVPPVPIPPEFLHPGENVVAVKVNNGQCCFTFFNLLVERVSARFLPSMGQAK